ncbi:MAG: galactose-1-phosphate uridylyltransferase [Armatimonadota bacterium]
MPELRKNIITREWVIISKERSIRPEEFKKNHVKIVTDKEEILKKCPFCPGNESMTPDIILSYKNGKSKNKYDWDVRVVPNKYPALVSRGELKKHSEGVYVISNGVGEHEVIIESPDHFTDITLMDLNQIESIITVYYKRYTELSNRKNLRHIIIFRNHGPEAGTSLSHPHSQLIATPVIPKDVFLDIKGATLYYEYEEDCPYCRIIQFEDQAGERKVCENDSFISICPFFSKYPFEIWILPRKHDSSFACSTQKQRKDLAWILKETLLRLSKCLSDPSYNLTLHSLMVPEKHSDSYHWHLQITPRITTPAGFELGTGMYINTTAPEEAAKFLSGIK